MVSAARLLRKRRRSAGNKVMTAAVFLGCLTNYVFPDIAVDAVAALERNGMKVILPGEQTCCGTPAWVTGDVEAARKLARINIAALQSEKPGAILILCASCGRMLKETYPELLGDESAREFAAKVDDATHFLSARADAVAGRTGIMAREVVAYHRPCHARWYDSEVVIEGIRRRTGVEVIVLPDACCGGAGTFSMRFPEQGRAIAATTLQVIEKHAVTRVLTPCPGCIMQLRDVTADAGIAVAIEHPAGMF
jgi:glycolate oxidase iron-sulfur subunit